MKTDVLYYGDNLDILRHHIPDESIDLIYLDPPFNSNRSYNVLFREESGAVSHAQIEAFEDTWHWGDAKNEVRSPRYELRAREPGEVPGWRTSAGGPRPRGTVVYRLGEACAPNRIYLVVSYVYLSKGSDVLKAGSTLALVCRDRSRSAPPPCSRRSRCHRARQHGRRWKPSERRQHRPIH